MIIYSDGMDVLVTESTLRVHKRSFDLQGIRRHYLRVLPGGRAPGLLMITLGLVVSLIGLLQLLPYEQATDGEIAGAAITTNVLAMIIGAVFLVAGLLIFVLVKERYALHLETTEGEKDAVVSPDIADIEQVDEAIDVALKRMERFSQPRQRPGEGQRYS